MMHNLERTAMHLEQEYQEARTMHQQDKNESLNFLLGSSLFIEIKNTVSQRLSIRESDSCVCRQSHNTAGIVL